MEFNHWAFLLKGFFYYDDVIIVVNKAIFCLSGIFTSLRAVAKSTGNN
jgi:hypothetical protein